MLLDFELDELVQEGGDGKWDEPAKRKTHHTHWEDFLKLESDVTPDAD